MFSSSVFSSTMRPSKRWIVRSAHSRIARIVRHHADRGALACSSDQVHHGFAVARIEVSGRFIREQDRGLAAQRAGDGDALLLTSGELRGIVFHAMRHADLVQRFLYAFLALDCGHTAIGQRQFDIFVNREVADQIETLEDETDLPVSNPGALAERSFSTGLPFNEYDPSLGVSRRPRIESSVDFPQPEGPDIATYSPFWIAR